MPQKHLLSMKLKHNKLFLWSFCLRTLIYREIDDAIILRHRNINLGKNSAAETQFDAWVHSWVDKYIKKWARVSNEI